MYVYDNHTCYIYMLACKWLIHTQQIECSLEYWSDSEQAFNKLAHFHISEVSSAEWSLPLSVATPTVASRVWRICLNHLEWVDEDMVEIVTLSK